LGQGEGKGGNTPQNKPKRPLTEGEKRGDSKKRVDMGTSIQRKSDLHDPEQHLKLTGQKKMERAINSITRTP